MERQRKVGYHRFVEHPVDLLRVTFVGSGHYLGYLYDFEALASELSRAGFNSVERQEVSQSGDPDLRNLEARVSGTEAATTLVVEAVKF